MVFMKMMTMFFLIIILLSGTCLAQDELITIDKKAFTIGESIEIRSAILSENRTINIYLPNGYSADSAKTYPVIYLLDGSADEDFIHIAGLVQFGSFSWINLIPETIVVGIANVDRKRDFTYPTENKELLADFPTTGGSQTFIRFLAEELQPFIDGNYKTSPVKTLLGQSLGGLLATEILFRKPDLFRNYIIVSPSLWWDDESLLKQQPVKFEEKKSVYIAVGKEGEVMERVAKELFDKLKLSTKPDTPLFFEFLEKHNHGDALHQAAYRAFEKLFKVEEEK
ncbi:MAG: alpha/beta hydrolase [Calditrichia bacterium]